MLSSIYVNLLPTYFCGDPRNLILIFIGLFSLIVLLVICDLIQNYIHNNKIEANSRKIKIGMSTEQVEALLGEPTLFVSPGSERGSGYRYCSETLLTDIYSLLTDSHDIPHRYWKIIVSVDFDRDYKVSGIRKPHNPLRIDPTP